MQGTPPPARIVVDARCGEARAGRLFVRNLQVPTPLFMPVGTLGAVKALGPDEAAAAGARVLLANAYHLMLRPGLDVVEGHGGLHRFMGWDGGILTDSGGFQVFSLAARRRKDPSGFAARVRGGPGGGEARSAEQPPGAKDPSGFAARVRGGPGGGEARSAEQPAAAVDDDGVEFASPVDGERVRLTPAGVVEAQRRLGSDIAMVLDECPPSTAPADDVERAVRRTTEWARRSAAEPRGPGQALFGIVQGALDVRLRLAHLDEIAALGFDGIALGGFSVGEAPERRRPVVAEVAPRMPADRPRYLMGVGTPLDLFHAVRAGIDMFDCVLPTRNGRNGQAFTAAGKLSIKQARFRRDAGPIEDGCPCPACARFSRAYLRHLFTAGEILSARLLTIHNLWFYGRWMATLREAILLGTLESLEEAARMATGAAPDDPSR